MQRIEDMGLAETFRLIEKLPEGVRRQQALAGSGFRLHWAGTEA